MRRLPGFTQQQRAVQDPSDTDAGHAGHRRALPPVQQSGATSPGLPQAAVRQVCQYTPTDGGGGVTCRSLISRAAFVRTHLHIEGPYNKEFLEMLRKCPAEDDGSVEYAAAKVSLCR